MKTKNGLKIIKDFIKDNDIESLENFGGEGGNISPFSEKDLINLSKKIDEYIKETFESSRNIRYFVGGNPCFDYESFKDFQNGKRI